MAGESDTELLALLRDPARKEEAFGQLVRQYQQQVYRYARRVVLDHDDAMDVSQNVFVKAWKNADRFRGDSGISSWLFRIATNEAINFLKSKRRHLFESLSTVQENLAGTLDNGPYISGDEIRKQLEKALLKLPPKQRIVFILRYFEEKPFEEISRITGTSEGALHASYHHAVNKLKVLLG